MPQTDVVESWQRIERWMQAYASASHARLAPGCTQDQLDELERTLGAQLPDDLRTSLRHHDGEHFEVGGGVVAGADLLGCQGIEYEWRRWTDLQMAGDLRALADEIRDDPAIQRGGWWRLAWVPVVGGDGYNLCVDLDPGPEGARGQVILMDRFGGPGPVVAPSFAAWLRVWADELEAGVFVPDGAALVVRPDRVSRTYPEPPPSEIQP